jgi:AcrR family transcriptional regulator
VTVNVGEAATTRGQATRTRITRVAAALMYERGVRGTSLDDVLDAAGAGKSQLYHYFATKDDLIAAVLEHQLAAVFEGMSSHNLITWRGLSAWFSALVEGQRSRDFRGCPVGALSSEMSAISPRLAERVLEAFLRWESVLAEALARMQANGRLRPSADPRALASTLLAAIQGGYALSSATRDAAPMEAALSMAYDHLRSHATPPRASRRD